MEDNMEKLRVIFILLGCLLIVNMAGAQVPGEIPLTNPGFEDGDLTGWSLWPTEGTDQSVTSDAAHGGTYALKTVGVDVAVYQTVTPTVGKFYVVRGFGMNPSSDSLAAGQKLRMEITIFDVSWGQLLQVYSDSIISETATDEWQNLFVAATCPEGAVYMNVGFNWIGTGDAGTAGSALGDDMRLVEMDVPETHGNFGFEEAERDPPWWHWGYLSVSPPDSAASFVTDTYSRSGSKSNKVLPQDWNLWVDEWWWGGYYLWTAQTIYDQVDYFEAGDAFYMSAWVMTPSDEQIFGEAYMSLELNFKDDAGTTINRDL
jgi:hypothetical protein